MASKTVDIEGTPPSTTADRTVVEQLVDAANDHAATIDTLNANIGGTLTADAPGRAKIAAGFFDAATVDSAFQVNTIGQELLEAELDGTSDANVVDALVSPASTMHARDGWFSYTHANHATETLIFKTTRKIEIVDLKVLKGAADAGGSVQLTTAADVAITDAVAASGANAVSRVGTIDQAQNVIAAGGTFKIVFTRGAGASDSRVLIQALPRA